MALPIILAAGAWGATKFGAGAVKGVAGAAAGGVKGVAGVGKGVVGGAFSATKFIASLPKKIIGTLMNGPAKILGFLGKIIGKPLGLLGISTSISSLLRQSQIFTGSVGALLQMVGAFIDIMIAPFMPYFASLMKKMGTWIPKIQEFSLKFHDYVVNKVFPWLKGLPQRLVEHFGGTWSKLTEWWDSQSWQDWINDPMAMLTKTWDKIFPEGIWEALKKNVLPVLKEDIKNLLYGKKLGEGEDRAGGGLMDQMTMALANAIATFGTVSDTVKDIMYGKKLGPAEALLKNVAPGEREGGGLLDKIQKWWSDIDWDKTATKFLTAIGFSSEDITTIKKHWDHFKNVWMPRIEELWEDLKNAWAEIEKKWGTFTDWWATVDWKATADSLVLALAILGKIGGAMMGPMMHIAGWMGLQLPKKKAHTDEALALMGDEERRMVGVDPDESKAILKYLKDEAASAKAASHTPDALAAQGDMIIAKWAGKQFSDLYGFLRQPVISGVSTDGPKVPPWLFGTTTSEQREGMDSNKWGQYSGEAISNQFETFSEAVNPSLDYINKLTDWQNGLVGDLEFLVSQTGLTGGQQPTGKQLAQRIEDAAEAQTIQMGQVSAQTIALSSATTDMVTSIKNEAVNALTAITNALGNTRFANPSNNPSTSAWSNPSNIDYQKAAENAKATASAFVKNMAEKEYNDTNVQYLAGYH